MLRAKAYAKINLSLDIVGVRDDGYHLIKTVMQSISLHDVVSVDKLESGTTISCNDPAVPCDERNIVYKCAKRFFERTGESFGIHIDIQKNIPSQAGLGGGSADGAAVLVLLNRLCGDILTTQELCEIGAIVGADIPFCIVGGCVLCEGIGEVLTPIDSKTELDLCIVKPDFGVSTVEAYKAFDSAEKFLHPDTDAVIKSLESGDKKTLADNLVNVLEMDERIDKIKKDLVESGAVAACMSGSGSAVFAILDGAKLPQYNGYDSRLFPARTVGCGVEILED